MMQQKPKLFIFDFDGCLYPYPKDLFKRMSKAYGHAGYAISKGKVSLKLADEMSIRSYKETGLGYKKICEKFNVSLAEGFFHHHQFMHFDLKPDPDLIEALRNLDRDQTHIMILTHSSRDFLDRKLKMLGLDQFFPRAMRVTHDDYNFKLKSDSYEGFVHALVRARAATNIDFQAEDATMFEDTPKNLRLAKDMGMETVLVHHNQKVRVYMYEDMRHIDRSIKTVTEALAKRPQRRVAPAAPELP